MFGFARVIGLAYHSQRVHQIFLWIVEIRQLDWEVELVHQLVRFRLDHLSELNEVLVHVKSLATVISLKACKALQNLSNVHVVNFVDLDQILKQHEDQVGEEACLPAEISINELGEDLGHDLLEVVAVFEDLT